MSRIHDFAVEYNKKVREIKAAGHYVCMGLVFDHEPAADEALKNPMCKVMEWKPCL